MGRLVERTRVGLEAVTAALPGGEDRPGQRQMAEAIARAVESGRHLLVQAGTGTGKTLAYLVPALLAGRRVVVATATLTLQDQLVGRDLPAVASALRRPVNVAVLKGRSNYACLQRLAEAGATVAGADAPTRQLELVRNRAAERLEGEIRSLVTWAVTAKRGDRAELSAEPSAAAWAAVSVGSRDCPGARRCPFGGSCFAERARQEAAEAEVVVVNTHLYAAHLSSGGVVLPPHELVVIDEAHTLEDVMAHSAGVELTAGRLRSLRAAVGAVIAERALADDLAGAADRLAELLATRRDRRLPSPLDADGELADGLTLVRGRVARAQAALSALPGGEGGDSGGAAAELAGRRLRALSSADSLLEDLDRLTGMGPDQVAWVEGSPEQPVLRLAPIDVGPILTEQLWDKTTAVLTSATLAPTLAQRLGLGSAAVGHEVLDVGSPFDYANQGLLYCAAHLPDPRTAGFEAESLREIERLVAAAGGRTLALFTSWRAMTEAARTLGPRLPWRVLTQADLPKPALLEAFAADEESCLFATAGFFQGVDIPGPALSLVIIDRLPFPRPDDPLLQARRDAAGPGAGFGKIDLPHAATQLAQAAGRLIRTTSDRGVVAVLDRRLATARSYRWELVRALPAFRRTRDPEEALTVLRAIRDARAAPTTTTATA